MNFERAKQILNSPDIINVTYKGDNIWIERLNPVDHTAVISINENQLETVQVEDLSEE